MKNKPKIKEKEQKISELHEQVKKKLERWKRMERGDKTALVEIMIERGMATKEDFPDEFIAPNARA
jgi:uncharacterized protein YhaN